ncbi:MAG: hypothetical protein LBM92_01260 [Opitutaceae bacterium]|jgi:hypothetical protein|nr:hypothetical protein [Opitutaceae bacterium]
MKPRHILPVVFAVVLSGCAGRPPHAILPPIAEEYHVCGKCGSLHGGIYGKGPLASFKKEGAGSCRHKWRQISLEEFQGKAAAEFPDEWAREKSLFIKRAVAGGRSQGAGEK